MESAITVKGQATIPKAIRDYLRARPDAAREYGELKKRLARLFPNDIDESDNRSYSETQYSGFGQIDYDVRPALAGGMVAVHLRRGPWGPQLGKTAVMATSRAR